MTNLTVDLEQAKRLKELGFPQDTYFYWVLDGIGEDGWSRLYQGDVFTIAKESFQRVSAPTLAELIAWLGADFVGLMRTSMPDKAQYYATRILNNLGDGQIFYASSPLEAVYALCEAVKGEK